MFRCVAHLVPNFVFFTALFCNLACEPAQEINSAQNANDVDIDSSSSSIPEPSDADAPNLESINLIYAKSSVDDAKEIAQILSQMAPGPTSEIAFENLLYETTRKAFPELAKFSIEHAPIESDFDFFQANLNENKVLGVNPEDREYVIRYNSKLFENPPPMLAVKAILVHELIHIVDYTSMSVVEILELAAQTLVTGGIPSYEIATDQAAIQKGVTRGLLAYRMWLFQQLDSKAVAAKKATYLTPTELCQILWKNNEQTSDLCSYEH
jgi:hypothetical protein